MDHDDFAEKFSTALYAYLWYFENFPIVTEAAITEAFSTVLKIGDEVIEFADVLQLVNETSKAILLLSGLTRPALLGLLENYFEDMEITRINVFRFVSTYCFMKEPKYDDIIYEVLHSFGFVFMIAMICLQKGNWEIPHLSVPCWYEIFRATLKRDFHAIGGWREFIRYVDEKRYASKDGNSDQRVVAAFLEDINYVSPKIYKEGPDDQPNDSENIIDNLKVVESQDNSEADKSSTDRGANLPGFNEKSEANGEVDKPQTIEASVSSADTTALNVSVFNEKGETNVEVNKPATSSEAPKFSSDITSNEPSFNETESSLEEDKPASEFWWGTDCAKHLFRENAKHLLIELDDLMAKVATIVKESKNKTSAQSSLLPSAEGS